MIPNRRKFPVTQYAAIFDDKNRMLMLQDAGTVNPKLKGKWVFPGGHIDEETSLNEALARELKEETSLILEDMKVFHVTIKKYPAGPTIIIYYKCKASGEIELDDESDDYKWISLDDVKKLDFRDIEEKKIVLQLLKKRD